jgi:hypothetical protein
MLAMYFIRAPVPNAPVYTQGPEMASSTGRTLSMLAWSPDAKVVASRGLTMPGLPLIGQSSRSPPQRRTASRIRPLCPTSTVLISMCTVPARSFVSVPASPQTTSSTAAASGRIDSRTSARSATSAGEAAATPPDAISSGDPLRR